MARFAPTVHSESLVCTGHGARLTLWGHKVALALGFHLSMALKQGGELLEATPHNDPVHKAGLPRSPGFVGIVVAFG